MNPGSNNPGSGRWGGGEQQQQLRNPGSKPRFQPRFEPSCVVLQNTCQAQRNKLKVWASISDNATTNMTRLTCPTTAAHQTSPRSARRSLGAVPAGCRSHVARLSGRDAPELFHSFKAANLEGCLLPWPSGSCRRQASGSERNSCAALGGKPLNGPRVRTRELLCRSEQWTMTEPLQKREPRKRGPRNVPEQDASEKR